MKRSVVIADDDPNIIQLVKLRLGMARFDVVSTGDAASAVTLARENEPVAVILDVDMPGGGGLSALSKIKADPVLCKLPVMMLTGERSAETVMSAMEKGASDYMVKPFDPDTLLERVSRLAKSSSMVWDYSASPVWEL